MNYSFRDTYIEALLKNYVFLNTGLTIVYNGQKFYSENGLADLLNEKLTTEELYPIIHLKSADIEIAVTHTNQYGEEFYSLSMDNTRLKAAHIKQLFESLYRELLENITTKI